MRHGASLPPAGFCAAAVALSASRAASEPDGDRRDVRRRRTWRGSSSGSAGWPRRGRCRAPRRPSPTGELAGSTHRSTGRWCDVGRRYWPIVTMSTPMPARSARQPDDLVVGLAHPDDQPRLRRQPGRLGPGQHGQAAGVAGRRAHRPLQPGDRLDVVVEHVGADGEQQLAATRRRPGRRRSASRPGSPGRRRADRLDARRDVGHAAVGEVVAGDHRQHGVVEAHAVDGLGDALRLVGRRRLAACACRRGRTRTPACSARRAP